MSGSPPKAKGGDDSGAIVPVDGAAETGLAASVGAGSELTQALLTRPIRAWVTDIAAALSTGALLHSLNSRYLF